VVQVLLPQIHKYLLIRRYRQHRLLLGHSIRRCRLCRLCCYHRCRQVLMLLPLLLRRYCCRLRHRYLFRCRRCRRCRRHRLHRLLSRQYC
jgi:hypothetical protein